MAMMLRMRLGKVLASVVGDDGGDCEGGCDETFGAACDHYCNALVITGDDCDADEDDGGERGGDDVDGDDDDEHYSIDDDAHYGGDNDRPLCLARACDFGTLGSETKV